MRAPTKCNPQSTTTCFAFVGVWPLESDVLCVCVGGVKVGMFDINVNATWPKWEWEAGTCGKAGLKGPYGTRLIICLLITVQQDGTEIYIFRGFMRKNSGSMVQSGWNSEVRLLYFAGFAGKVAQNVRGINPRYDVMKTTGWAWFCGLQWGVSVIMKRLQGRGGGVYLSHHISRLKKIHF